MWSSIEEELESMEARCSSRCRLWDLADLVTSFSALARQARKHHETLTRLEENLKVSTPHLT